MDESDNVTLNKTVEKKNQAFSEILDKIMGSIVKNQSNDHGVSMSVVESIARSMSGFGYEFTQDTLNILVDYLKGYNLWICGNVGIGKTFFFDCMSRVRVYKGYSKIVKLSMIETQGWNMDMARDWVDENRDSDILIDDVGTEPLMKSWGQEAELFPYLLEKRMQLSSRRTHLTSNLGPDDILKRYGKRVADRFVQFFKMEIIKNKKSRRVLHPWKIAKEGSGIL